MKIGILTQPLNVNYGGILQAYALQKVLSDIGHDVLTVNYFPRSGCLIFLYRLGRRIVGKFLLGREGALIPKNNISDQLCINTYRFIKEYIKITSKIFAPATISDFKKYNFDAYIVGSDQTWRPEYSPYLPTFFLDFLGKDKKIKRIAYASSFGVENWSFSPNMTDKCSKLAQKFDAISVREDSGITLCEKYLGVSAVCVLDPTMLLSREVYCRLIKNTTSKYLNKIGCYVLDQDPIKLDKIKKLKQVLGQGSVSILHDNDGDVIPPVEEFLTIFRDSDFIFTDSFHGTVFSIIFNKPFLVIGNKSRGFARFSSLLSKFKLMDRLIDENTEDMQSAINKEIDWAKVNSILEEEKRKSVDFLKTSLA